MSGLICELFALTDPELGSLDPTLSQSDVQMQGSKLRLTGRQCD